MATKETVQKERMFAKEPTDGLLKLQDPNLVLGVRFGNGFGTPSRQIDAILLDLCRWPVEGYVGDVESSSLSCRRLIIHHLLMMLKLGRLRDFFQLVCPGAVVLHQCF